jgi:hypothetical protein
VGDLSKMKYHYFLRRFTYPMKGERERSLRWVMPLGSSSLLDSSLKVALATDSSFGDISQIGSLAGAAHLLQINAGVLRRAQKEQKSFVEHKGKSSLDKRSSVPIRGVKARPNDPLDSFMIKRQCRR